MKIENYVHCGELIKKIGEYKDTLRFLDTKPNINFSGPYYRFLDIGTSDDCEQEFSGHVKTMIESIKEDITKRIKELTLELEQL